MNKNKITLSVTTLKWLMGLNQTDKKCLNEFEQVMCNRAFEKGLKNNLIAAEERKIKEDQEKEEENGFVPGN